MPASIYTSNRLVGGHHTLVVGAFFIHLLCFQPAVVHAQVSIPPSADAGRVHLQDKQTPDFPMGDSVTQERPPTALEAPSTAKNVDLYLKAIKFSGVTAFTPAELGDIHAEFLSKKVTLETAWVIAQRLTHKYRDEGYLLSSAYVPEQKIRDGIIQINAIEGYVAEVAFSNTPEVAETPIIKGLIESLLSKRPVTSAALEGFLLRLNDLPGMKFRSILSPYKDKNVQGSITLTLIPEMEDGESSITLDNYGSAFLGPHQITFSTEQFFVPLSKTNISMLYAPPIRKLYSADIIHSLPLTSHISATARLAATQSYPGDSLKDLKVDGQSFSGGLSFRYQLWRERQKNLSFLLGFDARQSYTDISSGVLTRDRIRALRLSADYNFLDTLGGKTFIEAGLSKGLEVFNASQTTDSDLSRDNAASDFKKITFSAVRYDTLVKNFTLLTRISAQHSSDILYSPEQFGFGGNILGRAYDTSEIVGDSGMAASLEVRYADLRAYEWLSISPYVFFDIGKTTSQISGEGADSASSAGTGFRFSTPVDVNGDVGIAFPLTRPVSNPIYGGGDKQPRISFQMSLGF